MTCRFPSTDARKCDRCGAFLWVSDEGWFCGDCGVAMPCTMQVLPPVSAPLGDSPDRRRPASA